MARKTYPSDLEYKFMVRMPEDLRDTLKKSAKAHGRSMNKEVVLRLAESIERGPFLLVEMDENAPTPDYKKLPPPHVKNTQGGSEKTEARLIELVKRLPTEQQEALLILLSK